MSESTDGLSPREAAWAEFRNGPHYTPTDRYPVRDAFDQGWTLRAQFSREQERARDAEHTAALERAWTAGRKDGLADAVNAIGALYREAIDADRLARMDDQ